MVKNMVGPAVKGEDCYGREKLVELLREKIRHGHVLLAAPRRFGKTSLMYQIIDHPDPGMRIVHVDLENKSDPAGFLTELIARLAMDPKCAGLMQGIKSISASVLSGVRNNLEEIELYKIKLKLKTAVQKSWEEIGEDLFHRISRSKDTLLLILDEFPMMIDNMVRTKHCEEARVLLHWLRKIRQESGNIRFLIAGSIGIDHILSALGETAAINDFERISVGAFSPATAKAFLTELARQQDLALSPRSINTILQLIGTPVPYFLQLMFSEIEKAQRIDGARLAPKTIEWIYRDKVLGVDCKTYFEHYYGRLRSYYQPQVERAAKGILRTLAIEESLSRDLCYAIYKKAIGPRAREDAFHLLMTNLENDFYIAYRHEDRRYLFACKLLRDWWLRHYGMESENDKFEVQS